MRRRRGRRKRSLERLEMGIECQWAAMNGFYESVKWWMEKNEVYYA